MLKLMKYEFIHSIRTFAISYAVFLAMCLIYPFVAKHLLVSPLSYLGILFNFGIVFLIIGIVIALFVSVFINFYHSMLKRPAYLSLTLPVSTTKLILSKVIVNMLWVVIGMIVLMIGFMMLAVVSGIINETIMILDIIHLLEEIIITTIRNIPYYLKDFMMGVFLLIAGLIFMVGGIYFSLTIAHTKWLRKHRLILGLVVYIALNILVSTFYGYLFGQNLVRTDFVQALYYLCIGGLLTFGTIYIFDHHIEIE